MQKVWQVVCSVGHPGANHLRHGECVFFSRNYYRSNLNRCQLLQLVLVYRSILLVAETCFVELQIT